MKKHNNLLKLSTLLLLIVIVLLSIFKKCSPPSDNSEIKSIDQKELNLVIDELTKDLQELKENNSITKKEKRQLEKRIKKLQDTNTELVTLNKVLSTKNNTILKKTITVVKRDTTIVTIDIPTYVSNIEDSLSLLTYKECCDFSNTILKTNYTTIDTTYFDNGLFMVSEIHTKAFPVLHKDFTVDYTKFIALGTEYTNSITLQTGVGFLGEPFIPVGISYNNKNTEYSLNLHLQNNRQTNIVGFDVRFGYKLFKW